LLTDQILPKSFHFCRGFLHLLGAFVPLSWEKTAVVFEQQPRISIQGSNLETRLTGEG